VLAVGVIAFGLAWWLGLYLLARDPRRALLRRAGGGLVAYALALACDALRASGPGAPAADLLGRLNALLVFLPILAWSGAAILLLPEGPRRSALDLAWRRGLAPVAALALVGAAAGGLLGPEPTPAYTLIGALLLIPLAGALALLVRERAALRSLGLVGLVGAAILFLGLGAALLIFPLGWVPRELALLAIGFDLAMLGVAVAITDAFDAGERLRPDLLRSLLACTAAALILGGQVALAMLLGAGAGPPLVALLLATVAAAIALQALAGPVQSLLDRLAFPEAPALQQARADLRASAEALPRLSDELDLAALDEAELARLTRRALSHMGDLPRLASSPLTRLPAVTARLQARGAPDHPLERAAELRALLAESIGRLKPRDGGEFGTGDAWRHYNALYFPYVAGLRPYSRRADHGDLDPVRRQALEWLATQVPERTLYNWQSSAARLIASDLRAASG